MAIGGTVTAEKSPVVSYMVWAPAGSEKPKPLPVALLREGEMIEPGDVQVNDVILLPKAYAEVVQVSGIQDGGTPEESWDLLPLPFPTTGTKGLIPWRLTIKALNGAADSTGAHRPIAVIRLGVSAPKKSTLAVMKNKNGHVEFVKVNQSGGSVVSLDCPLNVPLRTLARKLPSAT